MELIDLTKHWSTVSLEHACAWQGDTFDWCNDSEDLTSMEWAKEFLTNSYDVNLVTLMRSLTAFMNTNIGALLTLKLH